MHVTHAEREGEREAHTQRKITHAQREKHTQQIERCKEKEREKHNTQREHDVIHTKQQCYTHNIVNRYGVSIYQLDTGWE